MTHFVYGLLSIVIVSEIACYFMLLYYHPSVAFAGQLFARKCFAKSRFHQKNYFFKRI